jgi:hypothetical protein
MLQYFNNFILERFRPRFKNGIPPKGFINSPTLAYITVYGKEPEEPIRGMSNSPKRKYKDLMVDRDFKNKWLDSINNLPVEIRSTEVGKDEIRIAHVAFRLKKEDEDLTKIKKFVNELNKYRKYNVYAKWDIGGDEKRIRIMVAGKTWKGQKDWEKWWNNIAKIILKCYKKIY